jgi:hypothetical protein
MHEHPVLFDVHRMDSHRHRDPLVQHTPGAASREAEQPLPSSMTPLVQVQLFGLSVLHPHPPPLPASLPPLAESLPEVPESDRGGAGSSAAVLVSLDEVPVSRPASGPPIMQRVRTHLAKPSSAAHPLSSRHSA